MDADHMDDKDGMLELSVGINMIESFEAKEPQVRENSEAVDYSGDLEIVSNGGNENLEPYEGKAFESEEATREFYDAYAKHVGFVTRVSSYSRSKLDGAVISRRFVCNKEGFKKGKIKRPLAVTRGGCKAMINVKRETPGKWIITKFEREHNHPLLITSKAHHNCHHDRSTEDAKRVRELTQQLQRANQRCKVYRDYLDAVLKDIEEHAIHLSDKVQNIVHNIRQLESKGVQLPSVL